MSIQEVKSYVGVDVSSKHLDLLDGGTGKSERVKNDADAIDKICQKYKNISNVLFVMEASGGYESLFVSKLEHAQIPRAVVNARRVREFARSIGADAATDEIDAKVIAQFATVLKPVLTSGQSP